MSVAKIGLISKVLIIEDHELVRLGLSALIERQPDLEVCGEATTGKEARQMLDLHAPDIVIVELRLPDISGLDLVQWIVEKRPDTKVIVSTMYDEREYGERVLRLGAKGFVNKQSCGRLILVAIRHVLGGELFFSQEFTNQMLQRISNRKPDECEPATSVLSNRELEVLALIGQGHNSREIASQLFLSLSTIGTYRDRLKGKLNLSNATELTHFAIKWFEAEAGIADPQNELDH